jgi:hypothetical protein
MEILARNYDLSYSAGIYDFDVHMEVQMQKVGQLIVPHVLRYSGNWFLLSKKENEAYLRRRSTISNDDRGWKDYVDKQDGIADDADLVGFR